MLEWRGYRYVQYNGHGSSIHRRAGVGLRCSLPSCKTTHRATSSHVLLFLTGQEEIDTPWKFLFKRMNGSQSAGLNQSSKLQSTLCFVFEPTPPGARNVATWRKRVSRSQELIMSSIQILRSRRRMSHLKGIKTTGLMTYLSLKFEVCVDS